MRALGSSHGPPRCGTERLARFSRWAPVEAGLGNCAAPRAMVMVNGFLAALTMTRRLGTTVLKQFGKCQLRTVEPVAVYHQPVGVTVLAGQDRRTAGRTNRIAAETPVQRDAFGGNPVDVRGGIDSGSVGADRLNGVVIGKNKQDVGPACIGRSGCGAKAGSGGYGK